MKYLKQRRNHQNIGIWWFILCLLASCSQSQKPVSTSLPAPVVVEAKGHVIPQDSVQVPIRITVRNPPVLKVGKPRVVPIATDQFFLDPPPPIQAGNPVEYVSGQNGFTLPRQVPAIHKSLAAGIPEKILSKAPVNKDRNPKNISTFGLIHGLKNLNISEIVQDKFGNFWIATGFGGVAKYDGQSFTNYTEKEGLANNTVLDILKDHTGNLWFATVAGASKFDGTNFTNYTTKEGLVNDRVYEIIEDKNQALWFVTIGGISRLDKQQKTFTNFTEKAGLAQNIVNRILEDNQGNLWIGFYSHGVAKLSSTKQGKNEVFTFTNYTKKEGLIGNNVLSILEDRNKNLWFGTDEGVCKFTITKENKRGWFQHFSTKNGLSHNTVTAILENKEGKLFFGTENGITIFTPLGGTQSANLSYLTEQDGLPDSSILSLFQDNMGNIWIGTENGFCKYNANSFSFFTADNGPTDKTILAILEDKRGNIWFGTFGRGVVKYQPPRRGRPGTFSHYTKKEGLSDDVIYSMAEDRKGAIWFGTRSGGVTKYDPSANGESGTFTHYSQPQGLLFNFVTSILEDRAGNMWFGQLGLGKGGVTQFDGKTFTNFSLTKKINFASLAWSIAEDKRGNFWFGTWGEGVLKYEPAPDGQKGKFTHFTQSSGLGNAKVRPIKVDSKGSVWFGTIGGGVSKYEEATAHKPATFTTYTVREGLSSNDVRSILEDQNGTIWFGNYYGLSKLSTNNTNKLFVNFTQEDGFLGIGCITNSSYETRVGNIWIGTLKSLTVFDPTHVLPDTIIPNVQLTDIKLFNEKIAWQKDTSFTLENGVQVGNFKYKTLSNWYHIPEQLNLSYTNNFITFDFVGINTNNPQTVRYQYKLTGLDDTWSTTTNQHVATYGNLSPGHYVFSVKAKNGESNWSKEFSYPFTILPPWWNTWWAFGIYLLLLGSAIYGIIQYRVAQGLGKIRATEAIRTKISSDLHDDVGSILSGLAMQSQLMALTAKDDQKVSLNELSDMSHDAMERMRDTVWAIDSRKDKYENLIDRMRAFAERNLNLKQITHDFDIVVDDARKFIDPQKRQNIYLIFREAISNICKHSNARHVTIRFVESKNQLFLLVHDNGSGSKTINSDGLGLSNMKMRADQMGGTLTIAYDNGFSVKLELS